MSIKNDNLENRGQKCLLKSTKSGFILALVQGIYISLLNRSDFSKHDRCCLVSCYEYMESCRRMKNNYIEKGYYGNWSLGALHGKDDGKHWKILRIGGSEKLEFDFYYDADKMGKRLRKLRKSKNMTQAQLAEVLNVGDDMIGRYENGKTPLGPDLIVTICNFFHCSTDYLYFGEEREEMNGNDMIQKITVFVNRIFSQMLIEISVSVKLI